MNLVASELLKLRTTRATFAFLLGMLAITVLVVIGTIGSGVVDDARRPAFELFSSIATATAIFATILGVVVVTNEYRHGTITPTFLVTPRRERVIAAKVVAGAVAGIAISCLLIVIALAIAVPWLSARDAGLGFDSELGLAAARLATTFGLAVIFGVAVGTIIHSQVVAIVTTFAWFLILEGLLSVIAGYFTDFDRDPLGPYLPGSLFGVLAGISEEDSVDPKVAVVLLLVYTGALIAVGTVLTTRRDAD